MTTVTYPSAVDVVSTYTYDDVMKPDVRNPHRYIRIQNAQGDYLRLDGSVGDRVEASTHIQLGPP